MCRICQGWTYAELLDHQREVIRRRGWATLVVESTPSAPGFAYTIGLTGYRRHPELLISGLDEDVAFTTLNKFGAEVRTGKRFGVGDVVPGPGDQRYQFIRVNNPRRLVFAQQIYGGRSGMVTGLQAVWSDQQGRWPGSPNCTITHATQPLFGKPLFP